MNPGEAKKQLLWAKMGSSEVWCNFLYSHTKHLLCAWLHASHRYVRGQRVPRLTLTELVPLRDQINRRLWWGDRCLETQGVPQKTQTRDSFILGKNIPGRGDHVGKAWRWHRLVIWGDFVLLASKPSSGSLQLCQVLYITGIGEHQCRPGSFTLVLKDFHKAAKNMNGWITLEEQMQIDSSLRREHATQQLLTSLHPNDLQTLFPVSLATHPLSSAINLPLPISSTTQQAQLLVLKASSFSSQQARAFIPQETTAPQMLCGNLWAFSTTKD